MNGVSMKVEDVIKINEDYVVTESTIDKGVSTEELLEFLRDNKSTGTLRYEFQGGAVRRVFLSEKTRVPDETRGKVREILSEIA